MALAACGDRARLDALASVGEGTVAAALDGGALKLGDGRAVRLAGIEAPAGAAPYAAEARAELARLARGRPVELLSDGAPPDPDGGVVAHVRLRGGAWLEGALLERGAARVRTRPGDRALAAEMLEREAHARGRRRGLWALDAYRVWLPGELPEEAAGLQIVEGRVVRAGETRSLAYLDFARAWRDVASAEIPRRTLAAFDDAGVDVRALQGRLVRVRGDARRLRVRLDTPESLEVLKG